MQGVNCIQDLKTKLIAAGFEVKSGPGWYVESLHGRWTMALGVVYLNREPIKNIADAPVPKKKPVKKKEAKVKTKKPAKSKKSLAPKKSTKSKKGRGSK